MARMKKSTKVALAVGGIAAAWYLLRKSGPLSGLGDIQRFNFAKLWRFKFLPSDAFQRSIGNALAAGRLNMPPDYDSTFKAEVLSLLEAADAADTGIVSSALCKKDPNGLLCSRSRALRAAKYAKLTGAARQEATDIEQRAQGWAEWLSAERSRQEQDAWQQEQIQQSMDESQDWGDAPGSGENSNDYGGDSASEYGA